MAEDIIRFDNGESYEFMMGRWSLLVGAQFLDWVAPPQGARWVDVGCGNGAFTELIVQRCAPSDVQAFDPAPAQLDYARTRLPAHAPVTWHLGDAMQLALGDAAVDVAVMALVLFFVPDPAVGVAEMCRSVRSGGWVAAYHWDILAGGLPFADISAELIKLGMTPRLPPSVDASTLEASAQLWKDAGLQEVRTTQLLVERSFDSFDAYWNSAGSSNVLRPLFDSLSAEQLAELKSHVRRRMHANDEGPVRVRARANAVSGRKA